jgi:hypothetical protein
MFPATTDRFAEPIDGDDADAAVVRPLMAGTRLERAPLRSARQHLDPRPPIGGCGGGVRLGTGINMASGSSSHLST